MALEHLEKPLHSQATEIAARLGHASAVTREQDYAECRAIMTTASKNYSFASMVLPPECAKHVHALYAVMRVGDDRVDVSSKGFASPKAAIEEWQQSYRRVFESGGHSPYGVLRAYYHTCQELDIPPYLLDNYFRAMIEDLSITRFPTFADLYHYMEGSAIPVGRIMSHIMGVREGHVADAYPEADALSVGMQLTNFWRDVWEDWHIGRVYIPQEDMAQFGVSEDDIAAAQLSPKLVALLEYEIGRTEAYYQQARAGVAKLARGRWAVMSALEIYHAILTHLKSSGYNIYGPRLGASRYEKAKLLLKARFSSF